ncbi:hypothetical protein GO755_40390 [Spirosoma sp. HMF4905]|uniref:Uncharacterized protein n=1 Tax=Spirosoma arboris TaxID=2682092 RepID=A0A7K1SRA5_9BACT|nr:hypothetical protein [Spirosoma arboris]MVM36332.1 hypothetical protein [Spirosoma arboris]
MITNPLYAPQNVRAQYQGGMPASLAFALMPTDNFAQKRADAALAVQYQSMAMGIADQAAAEKERALQETQKSLGLIDQQNILAPDMRRLNNQYTERWRQQMQDEITNQYGGDIVRWKRERQAYHANRYENELKASTDFQQALANKTAYAQAEEAKSKGKLLLGNYDQDWSDYVSGKSNKLNYRGAYDPPKEGFDYFDKTYHPTLPFGSKGRPVEVSQSDLVAHLLSQGLTGEQASDYMNKIGYQGGRYWKMDSQKPWDASKTVWDQQMDKQKLNLAKSDSAETRRHHLATEAAEKAAKGIGGVPTIVDHIYNPIGAIPSYKTPDGQTIYVKPGATGRVADGIIRAAGIQPEQDYASSVEFLDAKEKIPNPDYDKKVYSSRLNEVYTTNFDQKLTNSIAGQKGTPSPFTFDSVDPSKIYYYGDKPFIHAVARINGKPRKVAVPISDSNLTQGELVNQAGIYNSKEEQRQYGSDAQTIPAGMKRRLSTQSDINRILNRVK